MPRGQSFRDFLDEELADEPELRAEVEESFEDMKLAVELAAFRERARLTQQKLSHETGLAQPMISKIERGEQDPTWRTLRRLLRGLGATLTAHPDGRVELTAASDAWVLTSHQHTILGGAHLDSESHEQYLNELDQALSEPQTSE